jgi:hypothetical protein
MCTISFIPTGGNKFNLVAIRDEINTRKNASFPAVVSLDGYSLVYPKDGEAGGSWIGLHDKGKINTLMNGAFEMYERKPPYKKSRGLVLLDSFKYTSLKDFLKNYDFKGIEPFSIISFHFLSEPVIEELRWDGKKSHYFKMNQLKPILWSSSFIYEPAMHAKKIKTFNAWMGKNKPLNIEEINSFLKSKESNFLLKQKDFLSVSISSIEIDAEDNMAVFLYEDLKNNTTQSLSLSINKNS